MNKIKQLIIAGILVFSSSAATAQGFVRKIEQHTFVPKGQWIVGTNVSFSESNDRNYTFLVLEGMNTDGYTFKVSPMLAYTFKDNISAGGRFSYKRSLNKITSMNINIDDETGFDIENLYSLSHTYGATGLLRNYISLGSNRRFALYNEVQITMENGQSKLVSGEGDQLTGTYQKSTQLSIGLSPGLVAFVNNFMAVEVSVGVLGLNFNKVRQTTDQVYIGESSYNSANFKINLFSIGLGVAFYL